MWLQRPEGQGLRRLHRSTLLAYAWLAKCWVIDNKWILLYVAAVAAMQLYF